MAAWLLVALWVLQEVETSFMMWLVPGGSSVWAGSPRWPWYKTSPANWAPSSWCSPSGGHTSAGSLVPSRHHHGLSQNPAVLTLQMRHLGYREERCLFRTTR